VIAKEMEPYAFNYREMLKSDALVMLALEKHAQKGSDSSRSISGGWQSPKKNAGGVLESTRTTSGCKDHGDGRLKWLKTDELYCLKNMLPRRSTLSNAQLICLLERR
jgi:hypothetical protein